MMLTSFAPSWRKLLLILAAILVCFYAVSVLCYVYWIPDIGLRCAFNPTVQRVHPDYPRSANGRFPLPEPGDLIVQVGDRPVMSWPQLLKALVALRQTAPVPVNSLAEAEEQHVICASLEGEKLVRVQFERPRPNSDPRGSFTSWCLVGRLPLEDLVPSILWFFLKGGLFLVGALVFWKRPTDISARQFFLLCIVTLGAYMGGYHWSNIVRKPELILVFMVCSIMLPAVLLHFIAVFPRPSAFLQHHPRRILLAIYGVPLAFLVAILAQYFRVRTLDQSGLVEQVNDGLVWLRLMIYIYLCVAALWYLASVVCLLLSYRAATDATERNQVKWILFGSLGALVPIGTSLYLAVFKPVEFSRGDATWWMFAASVCFTAAFIISITRYRLMQLDQFISSGMVYFAVSFLFGLVYYAVVFVGTLVVGSQSWSPLSQALSVSTTALVLMFVLDRARNRFKQALDRRFYR